MYKPRRRRTADRISLASDTPEQAAAMVFSSPSSSATLSAVERGPSVSTMGRWPRPVTGFVLLLGAMWLSLYAAYALLPFVRPGSVVIAEAKFETLVQGKMFGLEDRNRVMIFGHSKLLSGLRPHDLDAAVGPGFRSYNLGLPGELRFLPVLEAALQAGNVPTHVLLTLPWDNKRNADGFIDVVRNDAAIANTVFPFRTVPRDAALFVFQNRGRLADAIRDVVSQRATMLADRGWYFIKSQSHYEGDRLPDDYALPTDHPTRPDVRMIPERSVSRARLEQLAKQYGFQVLFVPLFFRTGEFAPPPAADRARLEAISDRPLIRVLGPDYFVYPPAFFSDPQHMNPRGAQAYSIDLAKLLKMSGAFD
ncbi:hypothetical protein ACFFWD_20370 [Bradyrhizobium erythrophlei]|uniref:hypothetical protein n=1 Tax=Bradyrhizobium erythrophlei TaxID=1437360 RepID=UPI0035EC8DD8